MIKQYFGIQNPKIDKKEIITFWKRNYYFVLLYSFMKLPAPLNP